MSYKKLTPAQKLIKSATHHDGENFFRFYKLIHGKKYAITQAELLRGL